MLRFLSKLFPRRANKPCHHTTDYCRETFTDPDGRTQTATLCRTCGFREWRHTPGVPAGFLCVVRGRIHPMSTQPCPSFS